MAAAVIILTLVAYVAVGLWSSRNVKTSDGFLIAGGSLGVIPLVGTYMATFLSAVSVLGTPSGMFGSGFSYLWLLITFSVGACLTAIVASRYRKVDYVTPADFSKARYGSRFLEQTTSWGSMIALIFSLIAQFTAMGIVWSMALNRSFAEGIIVTSLVMVVIIAAGGLMAVAWSDVLKAGIFTVAIVVAAIWLVVKFGYTNLLNQAIQAKPDFANFSEGMGGFWGIFFLFLTWSFGIATHPQYLQRMSAAKDQRTNMMQYVLAWPLLAIVNIGLMIVGIACVALVPSLPAGVTRDYIGPLVVQLQAPLFVYGLFLAGLTATALSTADSVIQLTVSYISHNVVRGVIKPDIEDQALLKLSRYLSLALVVFVALLTLLQWKWIVYIAAYCWGILAILYFSPTFFGLFWRRANTQGAIASVVGGLLAFLIAQSLALLGLWPYAEVPPTGVGVLAGLALMIVVSLCTAPSDEKLTKPFFDKPGKTIGM